MLRSIPRVALAALALLAAAPAAASADEPVARSAATCKVPADGRGWGPTYVTSLRVTATSCATGKRLVTAYYRCRTADGGADGRCTKRVSGWRCREKRGAAIPTQFDASVTCRKGRARVVHTYTQFT